MPLERPPAVAGLFYPAAPDALAREVEALLAAARTRNTKSGTASQSIPTMLTMRGARPKAIIAPHAGYIYSGAIAASVYALVDRASIRRVVLLGPTHRVAVRGLALPGCERFATPLGSIPIDAPAAELLKKLPQVTVSDAAHALEHSLEVHAPFLQKALDDFSLVPLAVGDASPAEVQEVLDAVWGGPETLIVVSSDLSHYLPYTTAQAVDRATADAIVGLDPDIDHEHACGATPVAGLLRAAADRGLTPRLVDLRNSGDTAGDRDRVVGYGAFAFYESSGVAH